MRLRLSFFIACISHKYLMSLGARWLRGLRFYLVAHTNCTAILSSDSDWDLDSDTDCVHILHSQSISLRIHCFTKDLKSIRIQIQRNSLLWPITRALSLISHIRNERSKWTIKKISFTKNILFDFIVWITNVMSKSTNQKLQYCHKKNHLKRPKIVFHSFYIQWRTT